MRSVTLALPAALICLFMAAPHASAADLGSTNLFTPKPAHDIWHVDWAAAYAGVAATPALSMAVSLPPLDAVDAHASLGADAQPLHAAAVEHSQAYETRKKIHKIASFATLPLFGAEVWLGQSLYNTSANNGATRAAHGIVGAGIVGLFAVNTVTGAWNMFGEDRKDPEGRTLRLVHGLLMMAADVGFLATTRSGPNSHSQRRALTFETDKVTHRNMAIASISVGTAGYLIMLIARH